MTVEGFRASLATLHWSQRGLADVLGTHPAIVRRWATGEQALPPEVTRWLETLSSFVAERPLADGWQQSEVA